MPVLEGKWRNSSMAASNPPAEPPIPTIGQAKSFVFGRAVRGADFTPLLFTFAFARDAFFCAVRFAAMAAFFMLIPRRRSHKHRSPQIHTTAEPLGGTRPLGALTYERGLPPDFLLRLL